MRSSTLLIGLASGASAVPQLASFDFPTAWGGAATAFPSAAYALCSAFAASATTASASASSSAATSSICAAAVSATPSVPASYLAGIQNPLVSYSAGGNAVCIQGDVPVAVSATGIHLNLPIPDNQTVVTEIFVQMFEANSSYAMSIMGGPSNITGTYNINSQICFPKNGAINASLVNILTHGVGFDKTYWNFAPDYSYVDSLAQAGYTTFLYDRLGVGLSAHPDPINVVQGAVEFDVVHKLTQMLRAGYFSGTKFAHVVGTGHSLGSIISVGQTSLYPKDLDAVVLTGYTATATGIATFMTSLDLTIARENEPTMFANLNNGYLVANNKIGNQFAFFRQPGFAQYILDAANNARQTVTFGELFSLGAAPSMAPNFTGPVDVVDGVNDWAFCQGNCLYPNNLAAAAQPTVYPNAKVSGSQYILLPVTGHGVNLHYTGGQAFQHVVGFLHANGY